MPRPTLLLLLAPGCTLAERTHSQSFPGAGITRVFCDNDRGSLLFSGSNPDTIELGVRTFARTEGGLDRVTWGAATEGDLLDLWGRTRADRAGVDFIVEGPPTQNVEAILLDGRAELVDLTGDHIVTASEIVARGQVGDVDLLATAGGIDLSARPEPGDTLILDAAGDTFLTLPYGLDYDLEVFSDPDWGVEVTNLGFDQLDASPDYVRAVTGSGSIRIEVTVRGGPFSLWNAER
jgi:hypothetical protein